MNQSPVHPSRIAAILLAAGRSRRMGAFKPLLPFGAQTVIETCVNNLLAAGCDEVVVVLGHRAEEVRAALAHLPVSFALNDEAGSEMGVSIARGVEALTGGGAESLTNERAESLAGDTGDGAAGAVLIALGDQPAVTAKEIESIVAAHRRTGARLVVPVWRGRGGHPVLVGASLRASLLTLDAERGLRALFDAHAGEVLRLPVASPYIARDMDTWEDYRALHEEILGVAPPDAPPSQVT
ncbi:MAG TPA: nucleotidyltransferase family protein [Pyrinomonadaceae bacterium]|nr:nucleotidyltransferase family protein [Pyrinomonadaceae bacterium]